jgi:hypothetical protein
VQGAPRAGTRQEKLAHRRTLGGGQCYTLILGE